MTFPSLAVLPSIPGPASEAVIRWDLMTGDFYGFKSG